MELKIAQTRGLERGKRDIIKRVIGSGISLSTDKHIISHSPLVTHPSSKYVATLLVFFANGKNRKRYDVDVTVRYASSATRKFTCY